VAIKRHCWMRRSTTTYRPHRFPPEIIQYAVWLYHRFSLGHRDVADFLAKRGITVSYETIRLWCNKVESKYARRLKIKHQGNGNTFFIDEVFVKIDGALSIRMEKSLMYSCSVDATARPLSAPSNDY
jgi:transposase-like protein